MRLGADIHIHVRHISLTILIVHSLLIKRGESFALGKAAIYLHDLQVLFWNVAGGTELFQQVGVWVGASHTNVELVLASSDVGDAQTVLARADPPEFPPELAQNRLLRIQNFLQ